MLSLFVFILGLIVGSFLNVVILRYNTGLPIVHRKARSKCFSCGKPLFWYELIPVVSYVLQKGRCVACKSKIYVQYPLVELISGFLFLGVFLKFENLLLNSYFLILTSIIFGFVIVSILLVISVYDWRHQIIPDGLVYAFSILSLVHFLILNKFAFLSNPEIFLDLLAGPIFFFVFFVLWYVSRGTWLGFGDAKLVLGIGLFLGFLPGISALLLAFWVGAVVSLVILVVQKVLLRQGGKALTMKSEIPFGPFLVLGTLLVYYFGIEAYRIGSLFTT